MSFRIGGLNIMLVLLALHLYLSTTTSLWGACAEESEEDFSFTLNVISTPHSRQHLENLDIFHFYLPAGLACEASAITGHEAPSATVSIPIQISFPSRLLELPGFSTRQFHLQVAFASIKHPQPEFVDLEFNFERAEVEAEQHADGPRAVLNATAALTLPCGQYDARVNLIDFAQGISFSFCEGIVIVVAESSHKKDFCYLVHLHPQHSYRFCVLF
jgi:hypothetical protein